MQLFKHTIDIARPRAEVFAFFTNWEKAPLWRQYVTVMQQVGDKPLGVGSRISFTIAVMGDEITYNLTVVAYEPPRLWRHNTNETHFDGFVEYEFDEFGDSTRVTFRCVIKPKTMLGWLAMPQMWLSRGKSYREQLPALKRAIEAP